MDDLTEEERDEIIHIVLDKILSKDSTEEEIENIIFSPMGRVLAEDLAKFMWPMEDSQKKENLQKSTQTIKSNDK